MNAPLADRSPLFEEVQRTQRSVLRVVAPPTDRGPGAEPVFAIGEPVRDGNGRMVGMAAVILESGRLASVLGRASVGPGSQVLLVDA